MASVYISDKAVVEVVPYASRGLLFRLDFGPFALVYFAIYCFIWQVGDAVLLGWDRIIVLVALPATLLCHLLVFLGTQWSVRFHCLVSQWRVASIDLAESVRVLPAKHCGSEELVPLLRRDRDATPAREAPVDPLLAKTDSIEIAGKTFVLPELWFVFQQTKFVYSEAAGKKGFSRLEYPSEGSFQAYLDCRGATSEATLAVSFERWGTNVLDIPMPRFAELFAEHAVAPFFVFQVLCVALWSLDDYWYYALFTLVMLVLFEAMLCLQRQKNLEMLRAMRREPSLVYVLRAGQWSRVSSEQVTPGEVVSLVARPPTVASAMREAAQRRVHMQSLRGGRQFGRRVGDMGTRMGVEVMSPESGTGGWGASGVGGAEGSGSNEALAPFDMVLMRGSCVVNEAMLTGESVPQAKTSLATAGGGDVDGTGGGWLRVEDGTDSAHRKHVIFSGTKVLQQSDTSEYSGTRGGDGGSTKWAGLPTPPDRGCPCVVLRTSFETSQGQLMKTILFATERVTAGSDAETGLFLFILLVFAAVASAFVLQEGLADETRNPFKLVLHCIMILTSVIPPELPIELSLAVINSLTALTKSLIFCTEPFRIPLAGKVDICCFDKTGTLTSDNLIMKGVVAAPATTSSTPREEIAPDDCRVEEGKSDSKQSPTAPTKEALPASVLGEVPIRILAGCHSLVTLNGTLVGDSVEVSTLKGMGWACLRNGVVVPRATAKAARTEAAAAAAASATANVGDSDGGQDPEQSTKVSDQALEPLQIVRCWPFDPSLRRMCTAIRAVSEMPGGERRTTSAAGPEANRERSGRSGAGTVPGENKRVPPFHDRIWIVAKGAPESIEPLLTDPPVNYRSTFLYHMGRGSRVLALAYRALDPRVSVEQCRRMSRAEAERCLHFGGFLVLGCPLKPDAPYVVRELRDSSHTVAMITGDSVLTAVDVARQVGMIDQSPARTLALVMVRGAAEPHRTVAVTDRKVKSSRGSEAIVDTTKGQVLPAEEGGSLRWVSVTSGFDEDGEAGGAEGDEGGGKDSEDDGIPFEPGRLTSLSRRYALCVTGDVLTLVSTMAAVDPMTDPDASSASSAATGTVTADVAKKSCERSSSLSATSAKHRSALSSLCGHVKVFARVSPSQKEQVIGELKAAGRTTLMCGDGTNDVGALRLAHVGVSIVNSPELEKRLSVFADEGVGERNQGSSGRRKNQRSSEAKRSRMLALREREEQDQDPALVKLGDASIASPFTAKTTSVGCVLSVIREGRCTLVTTLQVYKILALNCLTSAYMLSALYLKGVKQGDGQMTLLGLVTSAMFYCASRSQPMRRLSTARPPARIFTAHACISVLSQFVAHLAALIAVSKLCEEHVNPEDPSMMPDGPFRPNTFNSAVFLLSSVMQVNTFAANYTGHPFMQSLRDNVPMWWLVVGAYACILVMLSGLVPSLESWLQLVKFPEGFRGPFLAVLAADTAVVFFVEKVARWSSTRTIKALSSSGDASGAGGTRRKAGKRRRR